MMNLKKIIKNKLLISPLLISISLWLSFGVKLESNFQISTITELNFIRIFYPIILLFFFFFSKKQIQKFSIFDYSILLISISFLVGILNLNLFNYPRIIDFSNNEILIQKGYVPNKIFEIQLLIFLIAPLMLTKYLNDAEFFIFFYINLIFLFLTTLITIIFAYEEFIFSEKNFLYYTNFLVNGEILNTPVIRSIGLGRNLLILSFIFFIIFFFSKLSSYKKYIILFIIILIHFNLFSLQSRTSIYFFLFYSISFTLYFMIKNKWKYVLTILIIIILIPNILSENISLLKNTSNNFELLNSSSRVFTFFPNKTVNKMSNQINKSVNTFDDNKKIKTDQSHIIIGKFNTYSSGRVELWIKSINSIIDNKYLLLFGFGTSADRYLLEESVSNVFIYCLLSGGVLGLFILIIFYIFIFYKIFLFLISKKKIEKNKTKYVSIFIIIFILYRGLFETSFLLYGTDYLFLIISIRLFLNNFKKVNKLFF